MMVSSGIFLVGIITSLHLLTFADASEPNFDVLSVSRCPKALNGKDSIFLSVRAQRMSRSKLLMYCNLTMGIPLSNDLGGNYTFSFNVHAEDAGFLSPLTDGKYRVRIFIRSKDETLFCSEGVIKLSRKSG